MSRPRIALCTAEVGSGHTRAARALRDELLARAPACGAPIIDALELAPRWFVRLYRDVYLDLVARFPSMVGRAYATLDRPNRRSRLLDRIQGRLLTRLVRHPAIAGADAIATTHFLCAAVLSRARRRGRLHAPLVVCVTDQHPHAIWQVPGASLYVVASDAARQRLVDHGVAAERVIATGIPIDPVFGAASRDDARRALNLPHDRPVVLVTGGGLGLGGIDTVARDLAASTAAIHVVVICGRNEDLRASLQPLAGGDGPGPTMEVHGFTDRMPEFLAAADLHVGKPGGLTTSESSACGLPMVFLPPLPGQEELNAARFVHAGAAVGASGPSGAARLAIDVCADSRRLASMARASRQLGLPRSAPDAAARIIELAHRPT